MLALVCAALVQSHRSSWLSAPLAELARQEGVAPPRISELKSRLLEPFERLLTQSRRPGRRPRPADPRAEARVPEALLEVAADVLREVPIRRRAVQQRLVAAADRLHREAGILQNTFCQRLGLSPRTFRYWKQQARRTSDASQQTLRTHKTPPPKKPRSRNRGRFCFEVTLPGLQKMADTTQLPFLGVPLRVLALQDPGDRARHLLDTARVELEETALQVAQLVRDVPPGFQLLTDQGTPYLAEAAQEAYEQLELDHRPQKEGSPTEKATLERAFRTVKKALAPLVDLSNRLATRIPQLAQPSLARPLVQLLLEALLRVYHQSRQDLLHPCAGVDPEEFRDLAEAQRDRAAAECRSKKLLLQHIHQSYQMDGSVQEFVRAHRSHALEDIQESERRLQDRACRCIAQVCDRYFAGILNRVAEEGRARRAQQRTERERVRERDRMFRDIDTERQQLRADPCRRLAHALRLLLGGWLPEQKTLLYGGRGPGLAEARRAVQALAQISVYAWKDQVEVIWSDWTVHLRNRDPDAVAAVRGVVDAVITDVEAGQPTLSSPASAILRSAIRDTTSLHPPP